MGAFLNTVASFFKNGAVRQTLLFIGIVCVLVILSLVILNMAIIARTEGRIFDPDALPDGASYDCILILGAGVRADGSPTPMLNDRLLTGVKSYLSDCAPLVIVSGDSEKEGYSETDTMKRVLTENGVPGENIICDGYGLSTYDSIWRAKEVYSCKKILIITQKYHLHRALYIAEKMGLEADGCNASLQSYAKQPIYSTREFFARVKDFYFTLVCPKAEYVEKWN